MQLGNDLLLGVAFRQFMLAYAFFIPWDWIGDRIKRQFAMREKYVVLFDGSCGVCRRTMSVIRILDVLGRVEIIDATQWSAISSRFPQLKQSDCLAGMHVISPAGRVYRGFDGYRALARVIP